MCMVGVAQLVEHLVVVQVAAGSSPVTHPMVLLGRTIPWPGAPHEGHRATVVSGVWCGTAFGAASACGMQHNGPMLMGNKKAQRITVGVIIGVIVISLALTLLSTASGTS